MAFSNTNVKNSNPPKYHLISSSTDASAPLLDVDNDVISSHSDDVVIVDDDGVAAAAAAAAGLSMAVLLLIIVASLTLFVGIIYLLIYFKSIKPMSARSRSYMEQGGKVHQDDEGGRGRSAHPFFRRS